MRQARTIPFGRLLAILVREKKYYQNDHYDYSDIHGTILVPPNEPVEKPN